MTAWNLGRNDRHVAMVPARGSRVAGLALGLLVIPHVDVSGRFRDAIPREWPSRHTPSCLRSSGSPSSNPPIGPQGQGTSTSHDGGVDHGASGAGLIAATHQGRPPGGTLCGARGPQDAPQAAGLQAAQQPAACEPLHLWPAQREATGGGGGAAGGRAGDSAK